MKNHLRPKKIYLLGINLIISKTNSPLSVALPLGAPCHCCLSKVTSWECFWQKMPARLGLELV